MKVEYISHMGEDLSVVNDARVSFSKWQEFFNEGKDPNLIQYLADHNHWSPFSHSYVKFRVTAPIFVARQLVKHHVGFAWNEESRRYVKHTPSFWKPTGWRAATSNKKQGSGDLLSRTKQRMAGVIYQSVLLGTVTGYRGLLSLGVAEEQARAVLPVATNTTWIWTGSLAGWGRVASLRLDAHAQAECAEIVHPIADTCARLFPHSWEALRG
jgi:thymidylate synthase (FAD)